MNQEVQQNQEANVEADANKVVMMPHIEEGVPIPKHSREALPEMNNEDQVRLRSKTYKEISDLTGHDIDPTPEQREAAEKTMKEMITNPGKKQDLKKYANDQMAYLGSLVDVYNHSIVDDLAELKQYVVAKLVYAAEHTQNVKEQNSSMAMGALKQLNSDAKELQSMLQPTTQLEDWVKSKLNLAGEYLDDVYHHLDHFGPEGRKLDEGYYDDKERERQQRRLRFSSTIPPEKKYWFTPSGTVAEAGYSHEDWIKENDPSLVGRTLIDTYDNAVKKGYIRAVLDTSHNFLTLSNLQNYDFSMNGNTNQNVPAVKSSVLDAIRNFIAEKGILITATGKGNIIKDLTSIDESKLSEGVKDWLAAGALGLGALTGNVDAAKLPQSVPVVQTAVKDSELSLLNKNTSDYISHWEGKRDKVYNDSEGKPTIGIGHYLNGSEQDRNLFKSLFGNAVDYNKVLNGQQKLSSDQIEKLFNVDVKIKEKLASSNISNFNSLPVTVKNAIINALYRGDLGPKTIALMNSGKWDSVAKEYLDHKNAKSGPEQIKRRMNTNAMAFAQFAKNKG